MRANEIITELFKNPASWKWQFKGSEEAYARFSIEDVPYLFHAYSSPSKPRRWEIEFSISSGPAALAHKEYELSGTGNAAAVMSVIVSIMKEFLNEYKDKIDMLGFSADDGSRIKLYAHMVHRLLPTWDMSISGTNFILKTPELKSAELRQHSKLKQQNECMTVHKRQTTKQTESINESTEKPMSQCTDQDLQKLLGKGRLNALVKHPWFQEYRNYEHAYKHGVSRAGFAKVQVYSYFQRINVTAEGKVRPLIMVEFTFSYSGRSVIQAEKYYREKEPDDNEKRMGPSAGWKHFKTWAPVKDSVETSWNAHWDNKQ